MPQESSSVPRPRFVASRTGLTEQVYDAIVDLLLEGDLPEDTPIRIDGLAQDLGVSATPVREALARLESTGLVVRVNYKGYRTAAGLASSELQDWMRLRQLLEPEAAYLACLRCDEAMLAELEGAVAEQRASREMTGAEFFGAFMRADQRFHTIIHAGSGNRFLEEAATTYGGNAQRWRQFRDKIISDADESLAEHEQILAAFQSKDADAVRQAMLTHLLRLAERMDA